MKKTILRNIVLTVILLNYFSCSDSNDSDTVSPPIQVPTQSFSEFKKQFRTNDSTFTLNSAVQLSDSSYTLAGKVNTKNVIMSFDKYGNRNWTKVMENTYTPNGIEKLFLTENGYIGYRGHHYNIQNSSHIIYYNKTGDVEREIFENNKMLGNDMIKEGENFLAVGYSDGNALFRMLDKNGTLIWEKPYDYPDIYSIAKLTDGNYISIGGANYHSENSLIKLNPQGEIIWTKNHKGFNVLAIPNNQFLAITYNEYESGYLNRFDEDGNIIWSKKLDNFMRSVNKPSPINIISYNMQHYICTYVNNDFDLNALVIDQNGNQINLHTIERPSTSIGGDFTLGTKTIDDGLLIAYKGIIFNFGIIKLSKEFLFN